MATKSLPRVKLKPFEIRCPNCSHVTKRGAWSIAHMNVSQFYNCPECGKRVDVPAEGRDE